MVFSPNSRLTSALLAVCAIAPAWAQDDPGFKFKADYTLVSDNNLLRLPAGANVLALTGRTSTSEQISVYGAGLSYRGSHSLQRFELDLALRENRYQHFSYLNHTAGNYNAAWRWSLTPRTHGTLSHEHSEALNSFADYQNFGSSNKRTNTHTRLDATHELSGPWRLVGGLSQLRQTNQQALSTEGDYSARAADVGVRYVFASGSSFTYSHKNTSASYLNRTLPSAGLLDDGYDQRDDELRAHWVITGKSTLDASAGHTSRTHPNYAQRNYSGVNANTSLRYSFSGKAALMVEAIKHELQAISRSRLPGEAGVREVARLWLQPSFAPTRILVAELHCAAIRQPEVAALMADWQRENATRLLEYGLSLSQVRMYYMLLLGLSHADEVSSLAVSQADTEAVLNQLIDGWFADHDT